LNVFWRNLTDFADMGVVIQLALASGYFRPIQQLIHDNKIAMAAEPAGVCSRLEVQSGVSGASHTLDSVANKPRRFFLA
jgi:hypothetical protein